MRSVAVAILGTRYADFSIEEEVPAGPDDACTEALSHSISVRSPAGIRRQVPQLETRPA